MRTFIHGLRQKDHYTKHRWVVALTAIAGVFVGAIWIVYLSFVLEPVKPRLTEEAREEQSFVASTIDSVGSAISGFTETLADFWSATKEQFSEKNTVEIKQ
jgi:signal transduction protein with GAF and PtsI domain